MATNTVRIEHVTDAGVLHTYKRVLHDVSAAQHEGWAIFPWGRSRVTQCDDGQWCTDTADAKNVVNGLPSKMPEAR